MNDLTLRIVTPHGFSDDILCDSVHLCMAPDSHGHGEGCIGIRKGHIKSVVALTKGNVTAYSNSNLIFSCKILSGVATVENNVIDVVTEDPVEYEDKK